MKKLFLILGILIIADIFYFSYINHGQSLTLTYKPFIKAFALNTSYTLLFMGLYGAIGGFLLGYYKNFELSEKIKRIARTAEKSSVASEESTDKVKALEAKIQTLEVALKEALKNK
jgi:hypothetical protein